MLSSGFEALKLLPSNCCQTLKNPGHLDFLTNTNFYCFLEESLERGFFQDSVSFQANIQNRQYFEKRGMPPQHFRMIVARIRFRLCEQQKCLTSQPGLGATIPIPCKAFHRKTPRKIPCKAEQILTDLLQTDSRQVK